MANLTIGNVNELGTVGFVSTRAIDPWSNQPRSTNVRGDIGQKSDGGDSATVEIAIKFCDWR